MGIWRRVTTIFQAETHRPPVEPEDPGALLDESYDQQIDMLREVRRGIVQVTAAKKRLELQDAELRSGLGRFEDRAREALAAGREDQARLALERRQDLVGQITTFEGQIAQLDAELLRLTRSEARLAAKIETFRTRKEVVKAQHTAAQAQLRIGEALSGLSEEGTDAGYTLRRAEQRARDLRSRGEALHDLMDEGVLDDGLGGDPQAREFDRLAAEVEVDAELAAMRRELELSAPPAPKQLGSGQ